MSTPRTSWLVSLVVVGLVACTPATPPPGDLVQSSVQRITTSAPQADVAALVTAQNDFAFDLYRQLEAGTGANLVFSPTSITEALGMVSAGAAGSTAQAFTQTLHHTLADAQYHRAMNTLTTALSTRGVGKQGAHGTPFKLTLLNQVFSQKGFTLGQPFLDTLAGEYGAGVRLLDFRGASEAARVAINAWVKAGTQGLVPELLPQGSIDSTTRLTLVNTVYFDAAWASPFPASATHDGSFTLRDGTSVTTKLMSGKATVGYATRDGATLLELPYDGGEVSMLILMPQAGHLAEFEQRLTGAWLTSAVQALEVQEGLVALPRFSLDQRAALTQPLSALGLAVAFTNAADFTGISTAEPLQLQQVLHEAVVKTDEAGTVAAAATGVTVGTTSAPSLSVTIDHPFVFAIRDVATGAVLFVGRVGDPR